LVNPIIELNNPVQPSLVSPLRRKLMFPPPYWMGAVISPQLPPSISAPQLLA
jgi:hypothetical protein